jgi:protein-S-isoprenylcysteine O-methyltransferase Ste14
MAGLVPAIHGFLHSITRNLRYDPHGGAAMEGDSSGVRIFPPGVYLAGLVIGYILQWLWPLPILPGSGDPIVRIVGAALALAGIALMLLAVATFRRAGTSPNPTVATSALAVEGPYRFTRNPMYLGLALLLAGIAGIGNALWPLLSLIPVVAVIQTQVIEREERYLEAKFGAAYRDYRSRVRRWL